MRRQSVGIRELKANLSACLRQVRSGQVIVITERGKPVGQLSPIEAPLAERLQEGTRSHFWAWNGKKWQPAAPRIKARGKTLVSDLLLEDRS